MKITHTAGAMIILALLLGMAAVLLLSGCQRAVEVPTTPNVTVPPESAAPADAARPAPEAGRPATNPIPGSSRREQTGTAPARSPTQPHEQNRTDQPGQATEKTSAVPPGADGQADTLSRAPDEPHRAEQAATGPAGGADRWKARRPPVGDKSANPQIVQGDWPQWGGTSYRNNTPKSGPLPSEWDIGRLDRKTGQWVDSVHIKWVAALGSQSYGNPVVADGRVYVGTNNNHGYLKRYRTTVDLGCLLCFRESDGQFLWQQSNEKLPTGNMHDWEQQGLCATPYVEGKRLWVVTNRGHVVCLDTEGFYDGEDDGPVRGQWGRLFNVAPPIEPGEEDQLLPALEALRQGKLTDALRARFAAVGMPLPDEVGVQPEGRSNDQWTFQAKCGGSQRQFHLRREGSKLAVYKIITPDDTYEADTVWDFDMMHQLGVSQHNMCACSVTALGDILFVNTGNGVDESHLNIPSPGAPSFIAMNKQTGEVLWTDRSPGRNILHGQWSSPTVATLGGVPQVLFAGGDGWLYSFRADRGKDGRPTLLWKFDCNPKTSKWTLGGRGTRNNIIATPVVYDGLVYVAVGQDPEHGEGIGHLWCIDPTKRGDVSPQLAVKVEGDRRVSIPPRRIQAVIERQGEVAVDNPNSAVVWHYSRSDRNGDGKIEFEETMHRACGTVAIKDDLLYIADFSGLFHCLDAKTGQVHWTYDLLAAAWGSPLIADGKVYIGDEDGDVCVFNLSAQPHEPISEINMENSVYSTPVVANGVLYISNRSYLFAIQEQAAAAGR